MSLRDEITAIIDRIETGARIEGDPDCVFYAGHWHGTPAPEGTVCVVTTADALETVPVAEFYKDGRILWDIDENGRVAPKGTLAKLAEEEAAKAAVVTPEAPPEPVVMKPNTAVVEAPVAEAPAEVIQESNTAPEQVAQEATAAQDETAAPVAVDTPSVQETAPEAAPEAVAEAAPVTETVAEVTEATAEPAPETSEAPVVEVTSEEAPAPKRTKRTTL